MGIFPITEFTRRPWVVAAISVAALAFVLVLQGTVPFVTMPPLGVTLWLSSFAQALANGGVLTLHAHDLGMPFPAPVAFGLSAAYPQAIFILLGMHPADAYSAAAAIWLGVAFWGAYRVARHYANGPIIALALAVLWMSMPLVWGHATYATLSFGLALLPFYYLAIDSLFRASPSYQTTLRAGVTFAAVCLIAVFMDGYSFVMFGVAASASMMSRWLDPSTDRRRLASCTAPIMAGSFLVAYLLYRLYVADLPLERDSLDVFRGWGVDLSFLAWPTKGTNYIFDLVGLGAARSTVNYFGDASVWETTYILPLALLATWAWFATPGKRSLARFSVIAAFAMYMSMGPSLKLLDQRQPSSPPQSVAGAMPVEAATMRTGSSLLSRRVPGLKNMRASYRWTALGASALWFVVVVYSGRRRERYQWLWPAAIAAAVALNLPHLGDRFEAGVQSRQVMRDIDRDLARDLSSGVRRHEVIAALPLRNDFALAYAVAVAHRRTFNVSGDKNMVLAANHWPPLLAMFAPDAIDLWFKDRLIMLLLARQADVVAIPQSDGTWSDHFWPCVYSSLGPGAVGAPTTCGAGADQAAADLIKGLQADPALVVTPSKFFWFVRLANPADTKKASEILSARTAENVHYPLDFGATNTQAVWALRSGWYQPEGQWIWSGANASLELPRPASCDDCIFHASFTVFGANLDRPVHVIIHARSGSEEKTRDITVALPHLLNVQLPTPAGNGPVQMDFTVPEAKSPQALIGASDNRVLGIQLQRITLEPADTSDTRL